MVGDVTAGTVHNRITADVGHSDGNLDFLNGKAPPKRGLGVTGFPAQPASAASLGEWHYTIREQRQLQFAPATLTGDIRTIALNFPR